MAKIRRPVGSKKPATVQVTVRMSVDLVARLDIDAEAEQLSRSQIIIRALSMRKSSNRDTYGQALHLYNSLWELRRMREETALPMTPEQSAQLDQMYQETYDIFLALSGDHGS